MAARGTEPTAIARPPEMRGRAANRGNSPGPSGCAPLVVGIDQGTTGTRARVVDLPRVAFAGRRIAPMRSIIPRRAFVEHDAEEIWSATLAVLEGALADAGGERRGHRRGSGSREPGGNRSSHGDARTGHPIGRAIVWQDVRTAPEVAELARDAAFAHEA